MTAYRKLRLEAINSPSFKESKSRKCDNVTVPGREKQHSLHTRSETLGPPDLCARNAKKLANMIRCIGR